MTEGSLRPVWETLPIERQRNLLRTLGQMAMRQIRGASVAQQMPIGETADDDGDLLPRAPTGVSEKIFRRHRERLAVAAGAGRAQTQGESTGSIRRGRD